jgi:hypothetical protein
MGQYKAQSTENNQRTASNDDGGTILGGEIQRCH